MASGDTKTQQYLDVAANGTRADLPSDTCCETRTQTLIRGVAERIMDVEDEVERLENNPDVVDIVGTYADLQAYDTSTLTNKDIIRVLSDETHSDNSTYYRWNDPNSGWNFIGEISGGVNVVQTTGTSTTDVMSQMATTSMVFNDPGTKEQIKIGKSTSIGAGGTKAIAIGSEASVSSAQAIAIGSEAKATKIYSVALGSHSAVTRTGEVNVGAGSSTLGYNGSSYRVIGGVYDGQLAHDAATVGQAVGTTESYAVATSDWSTLSSSDPYTYQATVTATHTIGTSTVAELLNDAPVTFANYGFAIGSISGQSVTIYSIGQPSSSVTLKVNYKG